VFLIWLDNSFNDGSHPQKIQLAVLQTTDVSTCGNGEGKDAPPPTIEVRYTVLPNHTAYIAGSDISQAFSPPANEMLN
jgi:hypothetical protein